MCRFVRVHYTVCGCCLDEVECCEDAETSQQIYGHPEWCFHFAHKTFVEEGDKCWDCWDEKVDKWRIFKEYRYHFVGRKLYRRRDLKPTEWDTYELEKKMKHLTITGGRKLKLFRNLKELYKAIDEGRAIEEAEDAEREVEEEETFTLQNKGKGRAIDKPKPVKKWDSSKIRWH